MDGKRSDAEVAAAVKQCVRCGQVYRDVDNHDSACHYHPGNIRDYDRVGRFGDGIPGDFWDCCMQQITALNSPVPGCAVGRHESLNPAVPERSPEGDGASPDAARRSRTGPGEVIDVRPLGGALATSQTETLVKAEAVTVVRMVVPSGKEIPTHTANGELLVHCLEGKVAFTACGRTHDLEAGHLLHLPAGEPHSLRGVEDGSLLLTVVSPTR
jgi:quercetin dioxygenase-like cupin family protein